MTTRSPTSYGASAASSAAQAALLPELAVLDLVRTLPRIGVPIVMVQGRRDEVALGEAAEPYAMALDSPSKQFVWFDNSAHTPHLEEPDQFRDVLMRVRAAGSHHVRPSVRRTR